MNFPTTEVVTQTKEIFSKESQAYTHELKNKILELDVSLPNFHHQFDGLISTIKSFQDAAIKADFHSANPSFTAIIHGLEKLINLLCDRQVNIDWIIKELLIELINLSHQMVNEYCLKKDSATDWMDLQQNLFSRIDKHLRLEIDEATTLTTSEIDRSNNELFDDELFNNEPFNLDDTPEALYLFDIDSNMDSNMVDQESSDATPIEKVDNSDSFLMIQIDQDDSYLDSTGIFQDVSGNSFDELTTLFPSLLTDSLIDSLIDSSINDLDGSPTNLQGFNKTSNEERLTMPEMLVDIFAAASTEQLLENDRNSEPEEVQSAEYEANIENLDLIEDNIEDNLDNVWTEFTALEAWNSKNDEDLGSAFDLSDFDTIKNNIIDDDIAENMHLHNYSESLDRSILSQDADLNIQFENPNPNELSSDSSSMLAEILKQDFATSDIDTAIEESPIYQNGTNNVGSSWDDLSLINFGDKEISYADFSTFPQETYPDLDLDMGGLNNNQSVVQLTKIDNNDATIRVPINHLEMLGDLSEELLVRKGSLDIYLNEIKILSGDAQKYLLLLEPTSDSHNQIAIAGLQDAVEQIVNVLAVTEQQTYAMNQDVYHLRKNLRQVLKHPISSLVRKFPRILRDLSLQYGKQVELVVQGAEIEVERLISEIIAEPLELLLRNAFEHGIESPHERQQLGKSSQGKIEFISTQTDESTIIKVSDDGCGIDIDKIRNQVEQSAAIAGMSGFSTMDMSDEQLIGLIFEPSFNLTQNNAYSETGNKLSDVKKKLREFGGTISVQSQMGKGTQFTLVLPNILSLIRVLLIDINQMCLAIPSKIILEVVPCDLHNLDFENQETLLWRDRILPIVRLNSLLKLNCRHNLNQPSLQSSQSPQSINPLDRQKPAHAIPSYLVIHHENDLFALQTDGCWHDQEATFHQIEGDITLPQIFLGTVILGSNQAVALLNPTELVSQGLRPNDILPSHSASKNVDDLSSLSDFFSAGDSTPEPTLPNLSVSTERVPEYSLERSPEPENLESSGLFTSGLVNAQTMRSHQPRVLIVESSANVRRYLAMTLTKSGFLTEQVQDGKEAIAFLKEQLKLRLNVDVVITDLEMPHMDGFKLLSSIRADVDLQNLPIVVLTAKNNENDQKLALDLGANAYFCKPYREEELVKKLNQIISG